MSVNGQFLRNMDSALVAINILKNIQYEINVATAVFTNCFQASLRRKRHEKKKITCVSYKIEVLKP